MHKYIATKNSLTVFEANIKLHTFTDGVPAKFQKFMTTNPTKNQLKQWVNTINLEGKNLYENLKTNSQGNGELQSFFGYKIIGNSPPTLHLISRYSSKPTSAIDNT